MNRILQFILLLIKIVSSTFNSNPDVQLGMISFCKFQQPELCPETTLKEVTFSVNFTKTPNAIIGYSQIDVDFQKGQEFDFFIEVKETDTSKIKIQLGHSPKTLIHELRVRYIAFVDPDVRIHQYKIEDFTEEEVNKGLAIRSYQYKLGNIVDQPRKAECFLAGMKLNIMVGDQLQEEAGLFIETESFDGLFYVRIKSRVSKNSFLKVHIICMEFYDKSRTMKDSSQILVFQDRQIEDSTKTDLYKCSESQQTDIRSKLTATDISDFSLTNNKLTFFYGFTGFITTQKCNFFRRVVRFRFDSEQFKNGQFSIQYQTYSDSAMSGIASSYLILVNGYSTCKQGQCLEQNICQNCEKDCLKCYPHFSCRQCSQDKFKYLWDRQCFSTQPDKTFCDKMNCISCLNPSCQYCDYTLKKCICQQGYYRYNNDCYPEQPQKTFCKSQSIYFS